MYGIVLKNMKPQNKKKEAEGNSCPKLNIPSTTITFENRYSEKLFGQTKNGLVSGRLASTSSKTDPEFSR